MNIDFSAIQGDMTSNYRPIQVIANFSSSGKILPLYVKIEGFDVIKIAEARPWQPKKMGTEGSFYYRCLYADPDENLYKEIRLRYDIVRHNWNIMKNEE